MMFDRSKMTASEWANLSCEDRIDQQMAWRVESFEEAIEAYESGECEDLPINTEALSIEFCSEEVDGIAGQSYLEYIEICLSWGGPADYLRLFPSGKIEYHFQDWGDGAWRHFIAPDLVDGLLDPELMREYNGNFPLTFNGYQWKDGFSAPEVWI